MKSYLLALFFLGLFLVSQGQKKYSTADVHSHNDYENKIPFWTAYNHGFGSIEADIFLVGNNLFVGHDTLEIKSGRTLQHYYLDPIRSMIRKNHGSVYPDKKRKLELLIDVKTEAYSTLNRLVEILRAYPSLITNRNLRFIISGERPEIKDYKNYPPFILFDGRLHASYDARSIQKVGLISDDFSNYSHWNGIVPISKDEELKLKELVKRTHSLHRKLRFWATPDTPLTWNEMIKLQVDYINTDSIVPISKYLKVHSMYMN